MARVGDCQRKTWTDRHEQVVDPSTSRSTPAPHAATLLLRPASVRYPDRRRWHDHGQGLTHGSQLGREGQAKEDHRYRPHAIPQDRLPQVQQRFPRRRTRRCQGPCRCKEGLSASAEGGGVEAQQRPNKLVHDRSGVFTGKWYCSAWGVLSSISRLLSIRMTNKDGFRRLSSSSGGT
jgi:hypothetical protein